MPTAEIRAKVAELTKNASDEDAKLHSIYHYVSTQFRYIGVAFGRSFDQLRFILREAMKRPAQTEYAQQVTARVKKGPLDRNPAYNVV